jgi:hypothetical protein
MLPASVIALAGETVTLTGAAIFALMRFAVAWVITRVGNHGIAAAVTEANRVASGDQAEQHGGSAISATRSVFRLMAQRHGRSAPPYRPG